ncbi:organic cation transporter protein isoform X1 [Nematostella vectensis]|uniref:organic cation transporter protein isoform X1 n=1 Tax=Nematostella vectensis TaxID=45351 RepID=UPI0013901BF5|nr:organic cation transporter protein isoform X1 [Nematostella vectensis]
MFEISLYFQWKLLYEISLYFQWKLLCEISLYFQWTLLCEISLYFQWKLLCDRAYLAATIQSFYFAGMYFGALTGGWLADNFRRNSTMFIGTKGMALASLGSSFSDAISLLRFIVGFFQMGVNVTYFVYAIEILGQKHRTLGGQLAGFLWSIGYSGTALFAYLIRDWRMLIIAVRVPGLIFVLLWRIFPATPRWLIAHNRLDEAYSVLLKFGSKDSKPIDEQALRELIENVRQDQLERHKVDDKRYTMLDLVRTRKLRKRSFILFCTWLVCAIVHFGLFLYVTSMPGNLYNSYVMNIITFPKSLEMVFIMNKALRNHNSVRHSREVVHECDVHERVTLWH